MLSNVVLEKAKLMAGLYDRHRNERFHTSPFERDPLHQPREAIPDLGLCGRPLHGAPALVGCWHFSLLPACAGPLPTHPRERPRLFTGSGSYPEPIAPLELLPPPDGA